jgi:hypothetical protein
VASDTPPSHLKRNSAPSASSDGSSDSISTSEAKSQANGRKLDKSGNLGLQEYDTPEEGALGEISNYEVSKEGERENEGGERDGGEVSDPGSIDITSVLGMGDCMLIIL